MMEALENQFEKGKHHDDITDIVSGKQRTKVFFREETNMVDAVHCTTCKCTFTCTTYPTRVLSLSLMRTIQYSLYIFTTRLSHKVMSQLSHQNYKIEQEKNDKVASSDENKPTTSILSLPTRPVYLRCLNHKDN